MRCKIWLSPASIDFTADMNVVERVVGKTVDNVVERVIGDEDTVNSAKEKMVPSRNKVSEIVEEVKDGGVWSTVKNQGTKSIAEVKDRLEQPETSELVEEKMLEKVEMLEIICDLGR